MLRELSAKNLALIEDARVELKPGYCVWTGETGAGKSLLLTALELVLGGKASAELVRAGCAEARASAVFEIAGDGLRADVESILGESLEEDHLIITRRISAQGRGQAHVNDVPTAAATLRALGERLINIHGQHETRDLLNPTRQRAWLDAFGRLDAEVDAYRTARDAHDALRNLRLALLESAHRREREKALLAFERDELAAASPRAGESDELNREAKRLAHSEQAREAAAEGYSLLYEAERSAQGAAERVSKRLRALADSVPDFAEAAGTLDRIAEEIREVAYTLRTLGQGFRENPGRLEEVEARLAVYRRLSLRFRCKPDDLAEHLSRIDLKLAEIDRDDRDMEALDKPLAEAWERVKSTAAKLTAARGKVGKSFAKSVMERFKALSLGEATLSAEIRTDVLGDDPTATAPSGPGADHVEFLFAPNPGETPRPLRKIASGGELSRVSLSVKAVLAEVDRVPTMVFDEIDTGVGGRLGAALGKTLAELARSRQVVCVTHLPQMASFADHQWVIRKRTEKGRTRTTITELGETDRVAELAAMLRGDSAAEGTRQEASEMLKEARESTRKRATK